MGLHHDFLCFVSITLMRVPVSNPCSCIGTIRLYLYVVTKYLGLQLSDYPLIYF